MKRLLWPLLGAVLVLTVAVFAAAAVGSVSVPIKNVFGIMASALPGFKNHIVGDWSLAQEIIVLQVRLPRILLALLVGGGLSVSGVLFQGSLRNPLADPFIIGVSAGASVGAALALLFFIPQGLVGFNFLPVFAFLGALGAALTVSHLGRERGRLDPTALILAGVALGSMLTALVSFLMVLRIQNLQDIYLWLMGSLSGRGWKHVLVAAPYILMGLAGALWLAQELDVYLLGEETAHSLGIDIHKLQRNVLIIGSLTAAACVAVTGVIGFVGLMVPHALRLIIGTEHKRLVPASFWAGALFLLVADTLARTLFSPIELPVGIITAFIGGPFFIYLMKRGAKFRG